MTVVQGPPQGVIVGCTGGRKNTTAMVDTGDVHVLMIGAAGVGKTSYWLYPCIEYACASGMSFLSTDAKGDVVRNYGKEGSEIIIDNTQITLFGGFAPNSGSAEVLSKALGSRTVMSGSVSVGKNDPSESLQMIERPLMTADELKALPRGEFVVMKTGCRPMRVRLKLYYQWGIQFDPKNPYTVPEHGNRVVAYADKSEIQAAIMQKYHSEELQVILEEDTPASGGGEVEHTPQVSHHAVIIRGKQDNHSEQPQTETVEHRSETPAPTSSGSNPGSAPQKKYIMPHIDVEPSKLPEKVSWIHRSLLTE